MLLAIIVLLIYIFLEVLLLVWWLTHFRLNHTASEISNLLGIHITMDIIVQRMSSDDLSRASWLRETWSRRKPDVLISMVKSCAPLVELAAELDTPIFTNVSAGICVHDG